MEAVKWTNFSNEDFAWKFNGVEHSFPAGMEIFLEKEKADHFTKHLVDREMNKMNKERGLAGTSKEIPVTNTSERLKFEKQCYPVVAPVSVDEALNLNETAKVKKAAKKAPEFEDLQVKPKKTV